MFIDSNKKVHHRFGVLPSKYCVCVCVCAVLNVCCCDLKYRPIK